MPHAQEYERQDEAGWSTAFLAIHRCPRCRQTLRPVADQDDVWGCLLCQETWYVEHVQNKGDIQC